MPDKNLPWAVGRVGGGPDQEIRYFATHDEAAEYIGTLSGHLDGIYFLDGPSEDEPDDGFMEGERFPDRPDTPDFWRLSDTVLQQDGATEEMSVEDILKNRCDPDALIYMARQRAFSALASHGLPTTSENLSLVIAIWMDGFVAGQGFQEKGGHRDRPQEAT